MISTALILEKKGKYCNYYKAEGPNVYSCAGSTQNSHEAKASGIGFRILIAIEESTL